MDIPFHVDLPPVPGCFSKLLFGENETSAAELSSQPWREAEKLRELKSVMLKALALKSAPETPLVNGEVDITLVDTDDDDETKLQGCDVEDAEKTLLASDSPTSKHTPTRSLNTAISRLKREMVSLRHLDMSLFCQLLSLNEAIQDFKMSFLDRCTEYTGSEYTGSEYTGSEYAGSEYSFGEGMGSRVGSFSSLNEENDWNKDFRLPHDDPHSPANPDGTAERGTSTSAEELAASTSSFLQQIKDLTLRVETDF